MKHFFAYREEGKLVIALGVVIVASIVALTQIQALRSGHTSILSNAGSSLTALVEVASGRSALATRRALHWVTQIPSLNREARQLRVQNGWLESENARLREMLAANGAARALEPIRHSYAGAIDARVIGFSPENESRTVTIDRGSRHGVTRDEGVLSEAGVVGRVREVTPFLSRVVLLTDYTSSIPAVVERGRWWGIARGTLTRVQVEYIAQDARLQLGDRVVTGEARSFHSGALIGRIVSIQRSDAGLYQTAVVEPAVEFGSLEHVVVVPK